MHSFTPSERIQRIKPSPSTLAAGRVRELKAAGQQIHDLTVGEPDVDTPAHIKAAAIAAIDAGETKYTPVNGTPQLRAAIRRHLASSLGIEYADNELTVGGGGKQVIFLALSATLNAGDEVIIPAPFWVSYPDMVRANDGTPIIVETRPEAEHKITPEQLEHAISPRSRWLILNSPGNPTGAVYSEGEFAALAEVIERNPHVSVLCDEIYNEITFTGVRAPSLVSVAPHLRRQVLVVNGVSKSYAMTGWRLGYAAGEPGLIGGINTLQSQTSSCPSSVSQAAAVAALDGPQDFIAESNERYRARRDHALARMESIEGLEPLRPDGAFYLYVGCRGLIGRRTPTGRLLENDQDVVLYFLEEACVAVIQGSAYGQSPYFRMSFATGLGTISAALDSIDAAVGRLH